MRRPMRVLLAGAVLSLLVVSSALATRAPAETGKPAAPASSHEPGTPDEPLSAEAVDRFLERLDTAGLESDAAAFETLADEHGVGGAVRLIAWADATGLGPEEIAAMRAEGKGWGQIARGLGLHPGIGWIMSGGSGGNGDGPPVHPLGKSWGRDGAPGQQDRP